MSSCGLSDSQDRVHLMFLHLGPKDARFGLRSVLRHGTKET